MFAQGTAPARFPPEPTGAARSDGDRRQAGASGAEILALGVYQPPDSVSSAAIGERFGKTEQWIHERTGIESRRCAATGETVRDMARAAGADALKNAGIAATEIDLVIVATCSVADPLDGTAGHLAQLLGCPSAAAFDLNAACAGFCYGLAVAADTIRARSATRVLVIGAEKMTGWVDPADLGTSIIFGDGAGAAVLAATDRPGIGPVEWGSDGARADAIEVPQGSTTMRMEGQTVFRWATGAMLDVALGACRRAGIEPDQLDAFVPHQANLRIVEALATKLGSDTAVVARDVVRSGNTSAASIPLALHRLREDDSVRPGGLALLLGFGAGLTYAAQVVRIPE